MNPVKSLSDGFPPRAVATGPTAEQAAKLAQATYKQFLEEPERSKQIANIPKLLKKFEGNYGTMVKGLQKKYGKVTKKSAAPEPEPEAAPEPEPEAAPEPVKKKAKKAPSDPKEAKAAEAEAKACLLYTSPSPRDS